MFFDDNIFHVQKEKVNSICYTYVDLICLLILPQRAAFRLIEPLFLTYTRLR